MLGYCMVGCDVLSFGKAVKVRSVWLRKVLLGLGKAVAVRCGW